MKGLVIESAARVAIAVCTSDFRMPPILAALLNGSLIFRAFVHAVHTIHTIHAVHGGVGLVCLLFARIVCAVCCYSTFSLN